MSAENTVSHYKLGVSFHLLMPCSQMMVIASQTWDMTTWRSKHLSSVILLLLLATRLVLVKNQMFMLLVMKSTNSCVSRFTGSISQFSSVFLY